MKYKIADLISTKILKQKKNVYFCNKEMKYKKKTGWILYYYYFFSLSVQIDIVTCGLSEIFIDTAGIPEQNEWIKL